MKPKKCRFHSQLQHSEAKPQGKNSLPAYSTISSEASRPLHTDDMASLDAFPSHNNLKYRSKNKQQQPPPPQIINQPRLRAARATDSSPKRDRAPITFCSWLGR